MSRFRKACVNHSTPEYKELLEQFGNNTALLDNIITRWSDIQSPNDEEIILPDVDQAYEVLNYFNTEYNEQREAQIELISKQLENIPNPSVAQSDVVMQLIDQSTDIKLDEDTRTYYSLTTGKEFMNVHDQVNMLFPQDQYNVKTEKDINMDNRVEFGSQVDDILTAVIQGKSESETWNYLNEQIDSRKKQPFITYTNDVYPNTYSILRDVVDNLKNKGNIVIAQRIALNIENGVAGRPDLTVISPAGRVTNIDLKTSIYPFISDYNNTTGHEDNYRKAFPVSNYEKEAKNIQQLIDNNKEELLLTESEFKRNNIQKLIDKQEELLNKLNNGEIPYKFKASRHVQHSRQVLVYNQLDLSRGYDVSRGEILPLQILPDKTDANGVITSLKDVHSELQDKGYLLSLDEEYSGQRIISEAIPIPAEFNRNQNVYLESIQDIKNSLVDALNKRVEMGEFFNKEEAHKKELGVLNKKLALLAEAQGIGKYILHVNSKFGDKGNLFTEFNNLIEGIEKNKDTVKIATLNFYRRVALDYMRTVNKLRANLTNVQDLNQIVDYIEESPIDLLNKISNNLSSIIDTHIAKVQPAMAKWIVSNIDSKTLPIPENNKGRKELLQKQLKKILGDKKPADLNWWDKRRYNNTKNTLDHVNRVGQEITEESVLKWLKGIDVVDEGFLEYWWTSISNCPDKLTGTFATIFKDKLYSVDEYMMKKQYELSEEYEKYIKATGKNKNNVEELFKEIIEESTLILQQSDSKGNFSPVEKKILQFVEQTDKIKFNKDYLEARKEATKSGNDYHKVMDAFFKKSLRIKEGVIEQMQEHLATLKSRGGSVELKLNKEDIIEWVFFHINAKSMTSGGYRAYQDDRVKANNATETFNVELKYAILFLEYAIRDNSKINYLSGLNNDMLEINNDEGHYFNPNYKKLLNDDGSLNAYGEYHKYMTELYFEQQKLIPEDKRLKYRLPSVTKDSYDRFRQNPREWFKYEWQDLGKTVTADETFIGTGEEGIPIFFTNPNIEIEDVSKDVYQSVLMFMNSAQRYQAIVGVYEESSALLDIYKSRTLKDKKGIENKTSRKDSDMEMDRLTKHLYEFLQSEIYGKRTKPLVMAGIRVDKVLDTMMRLFSAKDVGNPLNVITGLAEYLQAEAQLFIEAAAKEVIDLKSYAQSEVIVNRELLNLLRDFNTSAPKSLFMQIMENYEFIQGDFQNKLGHKVSAGLSKRLLTADMWFLNIHLPEMKVQMKMMISTLLYNKITNTKTGEEIPLLYAYELNGNGKLSLKEGFKIKNPSVSGLIDVQIKNTVHAVNKRMHGIYNTFDRPNIEKHVGGRLLQMYRKFLVPSFKRRYKKLGWDAEFGGNTEGIYNTLLTRLFGSGKDAGTTLTYLLTGSSQLSDKLGLEFNNYDKWEQANLRRARADILIMGFIIAIVMLLKNLRGNSDDEDKKKLISYPLYWMMRLKSDQMMYVNPIEWQRIMTNPTAAQNTLNRGILLVSNVFFHHPFNWSDESLFYKRDEGIAHKGDRKSWIMLRKFLGNTGVNTNPQEGVKFLDQFNMN